MKESDKYKDIKDADKKSSDDLEALKKKVDSLKNDIKNGDTGPTGDEAKANQAANKNITDDGKSIAPKKDDKKEKKEEKKSEE